MKKDILTLVGFGVAAVVTGVRLSKRLKEIKKGKEDIRESE